MADTPNEPFSAALVKKRYEAGCLDVRREAIQYWKNSAFVEGEQWIKENPQLNRLEVTRRQGKRARITDNVVGPACETLAAKLLRRPLAFEVAPDSPDDPQQQGAKIAEDVLRDVHREHDWEKLREEHAWAVLKGGVAGLCVEWDPGAGRTAGQGETGEVHEGDTCESILTVTEMATEPGVRDIERARWWIKAAAMPPGEVRERYGADDVPADAQGSMSPAIRMLNEAGRGSGAASTDLALVLTYFERPNRDNPRGVVAVVCGGRVIDGPHPWPFPFKDRLNLVTQTYRPINGRWVGATRVSDALEPQTALNAVWSSVVEHRKKAGNAKGFVPEMSLDLIEGIDDDPGSWYGYRPTPGVDSKPFYLAPPPLSGHFEEIVRLRQEIDDILGVHDVSRGETNVGGAKSGVALQLLAEQDDTPVGSLSRKLGDCWGEFASLVLETLAAKVTNPRPARVEYDGLSPVAFTWKGESFAGQTSSFVPGDVTSTESRAVKFQRGLVLVDKGILSPDEFVDYVDTPGSSNIGPYKDPDTTKAEWENHTMAALGQTPVVLPWENFATHQRVHLKFMKSPAFMLLAPDRQAIFVDHVKETEVASANEMGQQVARGRVSPALSAVASSTDAPVPAFGEGDLPAAVPEQAPGEQVQPDEAGQGQVPDMGTPGA